MKPASVMKRSGLLVSVRDPKEALIAQRAGADVVDLKEPAHGPLGRCDSTIWSDVLERIGERTPLSAALGEWHEWDNIDDSQASRILTKLKGFRFAKLGPSGSAADLGKGLERTFARLQALGPSDLRWIAVVYADEKSSGALHRGRILEIARDRGCSGILVDTFDKSRPHFWNSPWSKFVRDAIERGMFVSLAGGLTARTMRQLLPWGTDLFAVRGAACFEGRRDGRISYRKIRGLVRTLERCDA